MEAHGPNDEFQNALGTRKTQLGQGNARQPGAFREARLSPLDQMFLAHSSNRGVDGDVLIDRTGYISPKIALLASARSPGLCDCSG